MAPESAPFPVGATFRHPPLMGGAAYVGLFPAYLTGALTMLYLSRINSESLLAGVGVAASVLAFALNVNIGFAIAIGALVSRAVGAHAARDGGRRRPTNCDNDVCLDHSFVSWPIWIGTRDRCPLFIYDAADSCSVGILDGIWRRIESHRRRSHGFVCHIEWHRNPCRTGPYSDFWFRPRRRRRDCCSLDSKVPTNSSWRLRLGQTWIVDLANIFGFAFARETAVGYRDTDDIDSHGKPCGRCTVLLDHCTIW